MLEKRISDQIGMIYLFQTMCLIHFMLAIPVLSGAQPYSLSWQEVATMPAATANHALTTGNINGEPFVFSFAGIDSSRSFSGIHLNAYRYDPANDEWITIAPLPDTLGKVAAGASTVRNKIYIIGGYHVFANGGENSSDRVHIYDPETDQYLPDGVAVPVPIDDHVQAVWRDSLIYVITGWSESTNVPNVQIYDPTQDQWTVGTPVPNTTDYKVFGGSGLIIGDTIFYSGGARIASNFPLGQVFRIGIIDPDNPASISWTSFSHPLARGYRMGAYAFQRQAIFAGGSEISYNYDGLAYTNSAPVPPLSRIVTYDLPSQSIFTSPDTIFPVMDLRGVAPLNDHQFMIAGGMTIGPEVSKRSFILTYTNPFQTRLDDLSTSPFQVRFSDSLLFIESPYPYSLSYRILNTSGQVVDRGIWQPQGDPVPVSGYASGIYFLQLDTPSASHTHKFLFP